MKNRAGLNTVVTACALILAFAIILLCAMISLGAAERGTKSAPGAPDSLVSAGAPRSQLELKRMFEAMSLTYTEGELSVYEPVSAEYRRSLERLIDSGEEPLLSVEEILFIISDSSAAYDKYDLIRFRSADGKIEEEIYPQALSERSESPLHVSALGRVTDVSRLIEIRIEALSAPDSMISETDGTLKYLPKRTGQDDSSSERAFIFGLHADSRNYSEAVVFLPGNGNRVTLYPYADEASLCRTKVILQNGRALAESERTLLVSVGGDASRSRNITPEYFYGETEIRLFAFGGSVIITDAETGKAMTLLPKQEKLTSLALAHTEDGSAELYFTASSDSGASVWRYADGTAEKLFESDGEYLAVCESLAYDGSVSVFRAARREDERFVSALECIGEPIAVYYGE